MYKLYDFTSNNEVITIIYNENYEQLKIMDSTTLQPFYKDDCITIIEKYENVEVKHISKYFQLNSFNELEKRFFNNELGENGIKLYQFTKAIQEKYNKMNQVKVEVKELVIQ